MSQKYALRYTWNAEARKEGYSKEDATEEFHGLCDAMMVVSIIRPEDGGYSQLTMSADGQTNKELTEKDIFKVWLMLGFQLSDNKGLKGWQKQTVDAMSDLVRTLFKGMKNE